MARAQAVRASIWWGVLMEGGASEIPRGSQHSSLINMGKNKQDTKSTDKGSGGKGGKGKGKADDEKDNKSSKGAQTINVRHILVSLSTTSPPLLA